MHSLGTLKEKLVHQSNPMLIVESITFKSTDTMHGRLTVGNRVEYRVCVKSSLPLALKVDCIYIKWRRKDVNNGASLRMSVDEPNSVDTFFVPVANEDEVISIPLRYVPLAC
jgi:hypothetical protein